VDWQKRLYKYSGAYVKHKIDELSKRWHSSLCFVKRVDSKGADLYLASLREIPKDELVAVFEDGSVVDDKSHYVRHSEQPNCFLVGK